MPRELFQIKELEIIFRLFCAFLVGFIIGLERESRGNAAGLKTHILVSVGAALVMLVSIYGFHSIGDPARLAAQVVPGMGFIGAGAIMRDQSGLGIKGITTAATLWVTAMIGLACGNGFYVGALTATLFTTLALLLIRKMEGKYVRKPIIMTMICEKDKAISAIIIDSFSTYGVIDFEISVSPQVVDSKLKVIITVINNHKNIRNLNDAINSIQKNLNPVEFSISNN